MKFGNYAQLVADAIPEFMPDVPGMLLKDLFEIFLSRGRKMLRKIRACPRSGVIRTVVTVIIFPENMRLPSRWKKSPSSFCTSRDTLFCLVVYIMRLFTNDFRYPEETAASIGCIH
jgi:hypothetical protein